LRSNAISRCRLLKIDCEGGEYDIVRPGILAGVDYLCGEFHASNTLERQGKTPEKLLKKVAKAIPLNRASVTGLRMETSGSGTTFFNLGDLARKTAPFLADV
jgi:hypothetical protein